jgi:hypothetical protein
MFAAILPVYIALGWIFVPQQTPGEPPEVPASQPASQPAEQPGPRDPEQARIFQALLRGSEGPRAQPILSEPVTGAGEGEGEGGGGSLLLDGTPLSQRAGRLVHTGDTSVFQFESGSPIEGAPETMEILKNAWLEHMEAEAEAGVKEFVISAEVTRYRGRNYLLIRNFHRQIDHGNLSP